MSNYLSEKFSKSVGSYYRGVSSALFEQWPELWRELSFLKLADSNFCLFEYLETPSQSILEESLPEQDLQFIILDLLKMKQLDELKEYVALASPARKRLVERIFLRWSQEILEILKKCAN